MKRSEVRKTDSRGKSRMKKAAAAEAAAVVVKPVVVAPVAKSYADLKKKKK